MAKSPRRPSKTPNPSFDEIYLEPDEEVTRAVERVRRSKKMAVAVCLPRHAALGQSIVNLKLLYKQATADHKQVAVVSPDAVTRGLAERVGFAAFETIGEVGFSGESLSKVAAVALDNEPTKAVENEAEPPTLQAAGFVSHRLETDDAATAPKVAASRRDDAPEESDAPLDPQTDDDPTAFLRPADAPIDPPKAVKASRPGDASGMIPTRGNLRFYRQPKTHGRLGLAIGGMIVLLGAALGAAVVLPSANVTITVLAQPFSETIKTVVDTAATEVNQDAATIPGKIVSLEHETKLSAKATGRKDIGAKATGSATIFNAWDSQPHVFAVGTTLKAKNGLEFVLTSDVTVPGATSIVSAGSTIITPGKKDATIAAAAPGDGYNIAAATFTIPTLTKAQQEKIYGASTQATTGGTSQVVTIVAQSDLDQLSQQAKKLNLDDGVAKAKEAAGDAVVLEGAIETVSQNVANSVEVNAQAEAVEATVTGTFQAISFTQDNHKQLLEKLIADKIPQGQQLVTEGDGVAIDTSQIELNLVNEQKLELTTNLKAFTVDRFNPSEVQRSLIGESLAGTTAAVKPLIQTDSIDAAIQPAWWPRLPFWSRKITVSYRYKAKSPSP